MRKTPEHQVRQVGALRDQGMSVAQIASAIGLSIPTVRSVLEEYYGDIPEVRRVMESIQAPWKVKKLQIGQGVQYPIGDLLQCIAFVRRLNEALYNDMFQRRWIVEVNKILKIVIIRRVS